MGLPAPGRAHHGSPASNSQGFTTLAPLSVGDLLRSAKDLFWPDNLTHRRHFFGAL
jgi:hypothetical protein